jgi:hypothetical protein
MTQPDATDQSAYGSRIRRAAPYPDRGRPRGPAVESDAWTGVPGGSFMRTALRHHLDIELMATAGGRGYVQRITGLGVDAVLERRGTRLVRLDVGDRRPPALATGCERAR